MFLTILSYFLFGTSKFIMLSIRVIYYSLVNIYVVKIYWDLIKSFLVRDYHQVSRICVAIKCRKETDLPVGASSEVTGCKGYFTQNKIKRGVLALPREKEISKSSSNLTSLKYF